MVKGLVNKKAKRAVIPSTVKYRGTSYQVTAIGKKAFYKSKRLANVTVGAKVTVIGKQAFAKCAKLKNVIFKTRKLKKTGAQAFGGLHKKAVIRIPKNRRKAYQRMFKKSGYRGTLRAR